MLNSQRSSVLYKVNNKKKLQEDEAYFKITWQSVFPMLSIEYPGNWVEYRLFQKDAFYSRFSFYFQLFLING